MSDNSNQDPGGIDQNAAGGGSGNDNPDNSSNDQGKGDTVSRAAYDKAVSEAKAAKKRLAEIDAAHRSKTEADLKAKEDWKALAEQKEAEVADLLKQIEEKESKIKGFEIRDEQATKLGAFLKTLAVPVSEKVWQLLPLDQVVVNPESGKVDQTSVTKAVEKFKAEWPELLKTPKPGMPNAAPPTGGASEGKMTYDAYLALPAEEMRKVKMSDIIDL
jgi:hypothetical protein